VPYNRGENRIGGEMVCPTRPSRPRMTPCVGVALRQTPTPPGWGPEHAEAGQAEADEEAMSNWGLRVIVGLSVGLLAIVVFLVWRVAFWDGTFLITVD
jgi:hypothetical protein